MRDNTISSTGMNTHAFKTAFLNGCFILKMTNMKIQQKCIDMLKSKFPSLDINNIQLMLSYGDQLYLLHTRKKTFYEMIAPKTEGKSKTYRQVNYLSRQMSNSKNMESDNGGQTLADATSMSSMDQLSCYDVICSH